MHEIFEKWDPGDLDLILEKSDSDDEIENEVYYVLFISQTGTGH